jgi:CRP-like cAMP-binding protein
MARLDGCVAFLFWRVLARVLGVARALMSSTSPRRLDIGLTLRTALPARGGGGELVTGWRHIVDAYARGWAVPDVASVLPFDALVAAAAAAPSPLALKLVKLPRLLRLRLVLRALRRSADVAKGDAAVAGPLLRLAQLVGAFLLLAHAGACAMWTASRWQVEHTQLCGVQAATGLRPLALRDYRRGVTYSPQADAAQAALCAMRAPEGLTLPPEALWSLYCADLPTKYMAMAYYALTTLVTTGYGDIVPGTNLERCCAMALQLAGCISCAVVFGNVALLLEGWDRGGARLRRRRAALQRLCAHHGVPPRLARAVMAHLAAAWQAHRGVDAAAALAALPAGPAPDVLLHLHGAALEASPLFAHAGAALRKALAAQLSPEFYAEGEVVVEHREACASLFFLTAGAAAVTRRGVRCATLRAGDCFGELQMRGGGARAAVRVAAEGPAGASVLRLARRDLEAVLADFPEAVPQLHRALMERHAAARAQRRAAAAALIPAADAPDAASDDSDDSENEAGEKLTLLAANGSAGPAAGIARRLLQVRATAAAQHRVMRSRIACAAKAYAELNATLDAALAVCGAAA